MVTHWGIGGNANGFSPKSFAVFFLPGLAVFIYALLLFLPSTDPYRANFRQFKKYYDDFLVLIFIFLFYIYWLSIFWNLSFNFNMLSFLTPAFALIFYYAGVLTQNARRNWFVGIRTPWTLSSDTVWQETHRLGGKLFKAVALISLLGLVFPSLAFYFIIIPVLAVTAFVFVYSYILYRREQADL